MPEQYWLEPEPGRLWCARCLTENFSHEPHDRHLLHGPSCHPSENVPAVTVMRGQALCVGHAVDAIQEDR